MTARGWVGFVSLVIAVAGAAVMIVQERNRASRADESIDTPASADDAVIAPPVRRVIVPDVVGLRRADAWTKIGDAMLFAVAEAVDAGPERADVVLSQDPAAGAKVASGTTVKVRVGLRSEPPALPSMDH